MSRFLVNITPLVKQLTGNTVSTGAPFERNGEIVYVTVTKDVNEYRRLFGETIPLAEIINPSEVKEHGEPGADTESGEENN